MDRGRERRYDDRDNERYSGYRSRPRSRSPRRRSPPKRHEYRERQRSPPRNYERPRSPYRNRSRSPHGRNRSPTRPRNDSSQYRDRSPPRAARYQDDRRVRRDYPPRDGPRRFPNENNYRPGERTYSPPRSPPRRSAHIPREDSPRSQPLSRRGSPPAERVRTSPRDNGYADRNDREYYKRGDSSSRRARTPPRDSLAPRERSPPRKENSYHERSPPRQQEEEFLPDADYREDVRGPARNDVHQREGPPTGPAYRGEPVPGPGHSRDAGPSLEPTRGSQHISSSHRQSYEDTPDPPRSATRPAYDSAPQSGRWPAPSYGQGQPRWDNTRTTAPAFRGSSNSTATTYPRTQRFNNALSSVGSVVEGGRKLPSLMDADHEKKLQQLEEEKKRLESVIEEKQRKKRSDLRDWDKLEREAKSSQLRSELAQGHLERLSKDIMGS